MKFPPARPRCNRIRVFFPPSLRYPPAPRSDSDPLETTLDQQAHLTQQVRKARGRFVAMAVTYAMGAFNDNFYKHAAILPAQAFAVLAGMTVMLAIYLFFMLRRGAGGIA